MRHPYAFRVQGGSEARAAERLLRFGVLAMNPHEYIRLRDNAEGKVVLEARPQLPGYFIGLFPADRWYDIRSACYTNGNRVLGSPLSTDGELRPLDGKTWLDILELNSYAEEAPIIPKQRSLKPGDHVILKGGIHAGKRFRVQATSKNGTTATAVLKMLGAMREVKFDTDLAELVAA